MLETKLLCPHDGVISVVYIDLLWIEVDKFQELTGVRPGQRQFSD